MTLMYARVTSKLLLWAAVSLSWYRYWRYATPLMVTCGACAAGAWAAAGTANPPNIASARSGYDRLACTSTPQDLGEIVDSFNGSKLLGGHHHDESAMSRFGNGGPPQSNNGARQNSPTWAPRPSAGQSPPRAEEGRSAENEEHPAAEAGPAVG